MTALTDDTLPITPRAMRDEMVVFVIMALALAAVPWTGIYPFFVMQALCFALLACAFNLLIGYGGLLSFGHAMFLGTAGYCSAHALKVWGLPPELGILVGTAAAAALGVVTGFISIRRSSPSWPGGRVSRRSRPDWTRIVSSLTLWYWRERLSPFFTWRILPT